jgi:hypothetical protein
MRLVKAVPDYQCIVAICVQILEYLTRQEDASVRIILFRKIMYVFVNSQIYL